MSGENILAGIQAKTFASTGYPEYADHNYQDGSEYTDVYGDDDTETSPTEK